MKKYLFMTMAMFIAMLSMTGCPQDGGSTKSIKLNETDVTLYMQVNKTVTLTATIVNGAQKDTVTWSSSDTTEEFVSIKQTSDGLNCTVTAKKATSTSTPVTITAALSGDSGIKAECKVKVGNAPPEGKYISLSCTTLELDTQNSNTYTLIATIGRGSPGDTVTWSSSDTTGEFVSITPDGLICTITANKVTVAPVIITAALTNDPTTKNTCSVTVSAQAVTLKSITLDKTTLALDTQNNKAETLTAAIVNGVQGDNIRWSSSDTTVEFVSITPTTDGLSCTVTAAAKKSTSTPVIITAALSSDAGIRAMCEVTVTFVPLELKLSTTATGSSTPHASAKNPVTTTLPDPAANIYTVNSGYNSGNWTSGSIFTDTTFVYIDKLITGDFKIKARVQVGSFPAGTATSRGMMVGGFKPNAEGKLAVGSSTAALFLQGNGEVRKALPRDGSPASLGGSTLNVTRATEFIYEFQRSGGFTSTVYISKNSETLDTDSTYGFNNGGINYEIQENTPVYAGIALLCVEDVRISQLELWIDDLNGDPVFYSGDSAAAEVKVEAVSLGVQGSTVGTDGTNPGSAANPATYVVKASAVTTSGIQLMPSFVPTYADNRGVKYFKVEGGDATLSVNEDTGKVTVTGVGTATFRVQSVSNTNAEYYLKITATADYMPIEDFNITGSLITGSSNTITVNQTTRLTTDISAQIIAASDPKVVWTASSSAVKFVVNGTEVDTATGNLVSIKGKSANAAVTITATATTQNGANTDTKTATTSIEVKALSGVFFEWNAGDGWDDNYTSLKGVPTKKTSNASGTVIDTDGSIKMPFNNRWVLGVGTDAVVIGSGTLGAGNANYAENAAFNLSKKYKLTIELASTLTSAELTIALNTEGGSNNGGPISGASGYVIGDAVPALGSMIFQAPVAILPATRKELYVIVDPSLSSLHANADSAKLTMGEIIGNQFMQFRINNNGAGQVNIYKIKLEYID